MPIISRKHSEGLKLLEYKTEAESKLGDKKAFELAYQEKQGKGDRSKK
jgi:hypothetical protein